MDTETLDKLYLEWSQFTKARTEREMWAAVNLQALLEVVQSIAIEHNEPTDDVVQIMRNAKGVIDMLEGDS